MSWLLQAIMTLLVVFIKVSAAQNPDPKKQAKPAPPTSTFVPVNPLYPKEVHDIFEQMPEYEFYEPKFGREWGYVENEALFPSEVEFDRTIYFRKSNPPPSSYKGYKFIAICYYYSKNMQAKTREGNPLYVAHYILVPTSFKEEIVNYIQLPVYNPIANVEVVISVERTFRQFQQVKPIIEQEIIKNPDKRSTPKVIDPMLTKNNEVQKTGKPVKGGKTGKLSTNTTNPKKTKYTVNKIVHIDPVTKKTYTQVQWDAKLAADAKIKAEAEKKKILIARKKAADKKKAEFLANIDLSIVFPAQKNKTNLTIVQSFAEERSLGSGGFGQPGGYQGPTYFVNDSMIMNNMRQSTYYPPFKLDYPSIPSDAEVNIDDIGFGLVAKYNPPKPLIKGMKYTFFFLAPANFKYPGDKRVYIPVYTLIPEDENGRPSDLREMLFDHFIVETDRFPQDRIMFDPDSGISHTIIAAFPKKISQNSYSVVTSKFNLDSPMKVMTDEFFLPKDKFKQFLEKEKLINPLDQYFEQKRTKLSDFDFNMLKSQKRLGEYLKGLFYFKSPQRDQLLQDAINRAKENMKKMKDEEQEKKIREKQHIEDERMKRQFKEELALKQKADLLNEELKAMREILMHVNPNSTLLKNNTNTTNVTNTTNLTNNTSSAMPATKSS